MLLAVAVLTQSFQAPIPGVIRKYPPAESIRMGPTEKWQLTRVHAPTPHSGDTVYPITVTVRGKPVKFRPISGYIDIDGAEPYPDGSVVLHRANARDQIVWTFRDSIWYASREKPVSGSIDVYRDRLNYAGSVVADANGVTQPKQPPEAYVTRNGVSQDLGPGEVKYWGRDDVFVLQVQFDSALRPAGFETRVGELSRICWKRGQQAFPGYRFLGRAQNGSVWLAGDQDSGGFRDRPDLTSLIEWRDGKIQHRWNLPRRWFPVGLSPAGWVLARHSPGTALTLDSTAPTGQSLSVDEERNWTVGIFREGVLSGITFKRPDGTQRLLWRSGFEQFGPNAFRFTAFYGDDLRQFRATPVRK